MCSRGTMASCQKHVLDEVGGHRDESGENVLLGEKWWCLQGNGGEICEASLDPDSGEEFCEICPFVRVIFCRKADESWMSARYGHGKLAPTDAGDHGLENGLEVGDGEEKHGELQGNGVLGEEHQVVHGFEEVENDVWNEAWCPSGICRNGWMFFCGYEMGISLIWCESDGWCLHLVEHAEDGAGLVGGGKGGGGASAGGGGTAAGGGSGAGFG